MRAYHTAVHLGVNIRLKEARMFGLTIIGTVFSWLLYGPFLKEANRACRIIEAREGARHSHRAYARVNVRY